MSPFLPFFRAFVSVLLSGHRRFAVDGASGTLKPEYSIDYQRPVTQPDSEAVSLYTLFKENAPHPLVTHNDTFYLSVGPRYSKSLNNLVAVTFDGSVLERSFKVSKVTFTIPWDAERDRPQHGAEELDDMMGSFLADALGPWRETDPLRMQLRRKERGLCEECYGAEWCDEVDEMILEHLSEDYGEEHKEPMTLIASNPKVRVEMNVPYRRWSQGETTLFDVARPCNRTLSGAGFSSL